MRRDSSFPSFKFLQAQDFFVTQPRIYLREQNREDSNKVEDSSQRTRKLKAKEHGRH